MSVIQINITNSPKAKEFVKKLNKHKDSKLEELRQDGLAFHEKNKSLFSKNN